MAWITLTEADLATGLTGPEITAAKTAAIQLGQTDPVAEAIEHVTREVRGRVAACRENELGPLGTIPDECKGAAIDMIVYRVSKRLPGTALLKEQREKAHDRALAFLRDVARCEVAIVKPDTVSDEVTSSPSPRWSARRRKFSRSQQDGI